VVVSEFRRNLVAVLVSVSDPGLVSADSIRLSDKCLSNDYDLDLDIVSDMVLGSVSIRFSSSAVRIVSVLDVTFVFTRLV
jgi:hypothetical protein